MRFSLKSTSLWGLEFNWISWIQREVSVHIEMHHVVGFLIPSSVISPKERPGWADLDTTWKHLPDRAHLAIRNFFAILLNFLQYRYAQNTPDRYLLWTCLRFYKRGLWGNLWGKMKIKYETTCFPGCRLPRYEEVCSYHWWANRISKKLSTPLEFSRKT